MRWFQVVLAAGVCLSAASAARGAPVVLTAEQTAKLRHIAFQAAREGDTKTLKEYFAAGRPVNEANGRGDTLLTVAAYHGQAAAVEVVLQQRAVRVDARNRMGLTALAAAAFQGHVEIARALVQAGAGVDAANGAGQTPLMFAALTGRAKVVEYLLSAGADAGARDRSGNTPLSLAQMQGADNVVKVLQAARSRQK